MYDILHNAMDIHKFQLTFQVKQEKTTNLLKFKAIQSNSFGFRVIQSNSSRTHVIRN